MSSPTELAPASDHKVECVSCLGSFPTTDMHRTDCHHMYCIECLRAMFMVALGKGGAFPPRCCKSPIELTPQLAIALGKNITAGYFAKRIETDTVTNVRTYCANSDCGAFIANDYKVQNLAVCQNCDYFTCTKCTKLYHEGDCAPEEGLMELEQEAKKEGWTHCYKCNRLVEKTEGCDKIECACGAIFCYKCSAPTNKCTCKKSGALTRRGRPLSDLGGFDRLEKKRAAQRRALLKRLARGEQVEEDADDEADMATTTTTTVQLTAMAQPAAMVQSTTTVQSTVTVQSTAPQQPPHEQRGISCNHHSKKDKIYADNTCQLCQRRGLSYTLQCRRCHVRACWVCFSTYQQR
ncbi:hypothetical protein F5Y13DRAFT_204088 [Hypoxylon sp. FL1857]|nr:hypothetical protein F5Y13DRAFT_204088 [Hypoxylon sp. FL1857]